MHPDSDENKNLAYDQPDPGVVPGRKVIHPSGTAPGSEIKCVHEIHALDLDTAVKFPAPDADALLGCEIKNQREILAHDLDTAKEIHALVLDTATAEEFPGLDTAMVNPGDDRGVHAETPFAGAHLDNDELKNPALDQPDRGVKTGREVKHLGTAPASEIKYLHETLTPAMDPAMKLPALDAAVVNLGVHEQTSLPAIRAPVVPDAFHGSEVEFLRKILAPDLDTAEEIHAYALDTAKEIPGVDTVPKNPDAETVFNTLGAKQVLLAHAMAACAAQFQGLHPGMTPKQAMISAIHMAAEERNIDKAEVLKAFGAIDELHLQ
jgi:hypothetical protein